MRFQRLLRSPPNTSRSPRRIAAAKRAVDKETAKLGFFVDQFHVDTVDERLDRMDRIHIEWNKQFRQNRAKWWWKVRRLLFSLPAERRHALIEEWNATPYPGTPEYVLGFLRERGIYDDDDWW